MAANNAQTLRLRRNPSTPDKPKLPRNSGILQDQLRRATKRPWAPSFSLAVRMLLIMRVTGAMYSNIDDCDEVFNFWEPLHFLDRGVGFQTWEVSPEFAIRSWAYILLHLLPAKLAAVSVGHDNKRAAFFAVRIALGILSSIAEAKFYRTVLEKVNERVGRYLFFMLIFSAGMWNASTALLPSSFAMYAVTLAYSYALNPTSSGNHRRTFFSTLLFAVSGIVGWPFAVALAIPFIFEELFIRGSDRVHHIALGTWFSNRFRRLLYSAVAASLIFIPVIGVDSIIYGKLAIVPWNIVQYNIFGGADRGPDLYGTSPLSFYLLNLVLNFNILVPFALFALPALAITYRIDRKRLGFVTPTSDQSSPFTILALRMLPFYIWFGILSAQAHKEERFMFPAYPLLCFNASVTLYLARGWLEVAFIAWTKSPYRASKSHIFRNFTTAVILASATISIARILALYKYYHAPMSVMITFENVELPRLLNATGLLPVAPPNTEPEDLPRVDLSPIKDFDLRLCVAKEWHRFPGHYLVPDGVRVDFVKSEFDGMLPGHFGEGAERKSQSPQQFGAQFSALADSIWPKSATRRVPAGLNDRNLEEPSHYAAISECDYLLDLDFPANPIVSAFEPRHAVDATTWDRVRCAPFLDARHSSLLTRTLWLPAPEWQRLNSFGEFCLLRNRANVSRKEKLQVQKQKK